MTDHAICAVIVNYNSGDYLLRAVKSLMHYQPDMSIVVVDNHSTDGSCDELPAMCTDHHKLRVLKNQTNRGFAAANNQILLETESNYQYYLVMNPDCELISSTASHLVDIMNNDHQIATASCLIRNTDGSAQETCRRRFPTPMNSLARMVGLNKLFPESETFADFNLGQGKTNGGMETVDAVSGAFMVMRGEIVRALRGLDEDYFMHCEDLDWCKRVIDSGYKNVFVGEVEVIHHKGVSTGSRPLSVNRYLHEGMWKFYNKHYRQQYPRPVMWLVYVGIKLRFYLKNLSLSFPSRRSSVVID